jgi:nitroreductase
MNRIATAAADPTTTLAPHPSHASGNPVPTNAVIETILSRTSAKYYDPNATLSDEQIRELVRIGTSAPTSFHLQNWRFIAVRTPEAKARLRPIAWNQPAITDAAVTFIVIGQLADASTVPARLAPVVEAGIMPAHLVPEWENPARGLYDDQPQQQRDEALRTATLGAAAIIYAARSLGWGSTPMIGFDADAVHREFGLADDEIPVMLLSVGPERAGNWPQKPRMPVADVLDFE